MHPKGLRRRIALVVFGTMAFGAVTHAGASNLLPPFPGHMSVDLSASFSPAKLPRRQYVPTAANTVGHIETADGSHPSALREAVVDVDRHLRLNVEDLPACRGGSRHDISDPQAILKSCRKASVGKGKGHFAIAFPEQEPLTVEAPIAVFNGGERDGEVKLLIHALIPVPKPTPIVAVARVQRKSRGLHSTLQIPVVAGGAGSLIDFQIGLRRTYVRDGRKLSLLEARCPDGRFKVNLPKLLFKNEAKVPRVAPTTTLKGGFAVPCTPKG